MRKIAQKEKSTHEYWDIDGSNKTECDFYSIDFREHPTVYVVLNLV